MSLNKLQSTLSKPSFMEIGSLYCIIINNCIYISSEWYSIFWFILCKISFSSQSPKPKYDSCTHILKDPTLSRPLILSVLFRKERMPRQHHPKPVLFSSHTSPWHHFLSSGHSYPNPSNPDDEWVVALVHPSLSSWKYPQH